MRYAYIGPKNIYEERRAVWDDAAENGDLQYLLNCFVYTDAAMIEGLHRHFDEIEWYKAQLRDRDQRVAELEQRIEAYNNKMENFFLINRV